VRCQTPKGKKQRKDNYPKVLLHNTDAYAETNHPLASDECPREKVQREKDEPEKREPRDEVKNPGTRDLRLPSPKPSLLTATAIAGQEGTGAETRAEKATVVVETADPVQGTESGGRFEGSEEVAAAGEAESGARVGSGTVERRPRE
jgi:hypothetical protein